ncbi:MAG: ABC transporter substrate-binding protein [Caldilineaceae bacterium]
MTKVLHHFWAALMIGTLLLSACTQPIPTAPSAAPAAAENSQAASSDSEAGAPQPGGVWTSVSSADATILNPILWSDAASGGVGGYFFPSLIGVNPFSGEFEATQMAESWDVSADGLVWTFHLRDGVVWSDGDPVDAADFKFTYDAIASDLVETPRKSAVEQIESIEVLDPLTIQVTFKEVKCDGLGDLGLGWLPSHLYAADFSDIMENPLNEAPAVSAGPFVFQSWNRDENTIMLRNDSYWEGAPLMEGLITKVVPNAGARLAQLKSNEVSAISLQPDQIEEAKADPNINIYKFNDDGYDYIGLNLADPANPQPGQDEDGNLIDQAPHPILSDLNVRKAIAHALDYNAIIDSVYLGQGYQVASNVLPAVEWAHDAAIQPYDYDPEAAKALLEEAGWVDNDGDGIREKDGKTLSLTLKTNAGNTTRENLGVLVQDQLNAIGFQIDFQAIDFGTLVGELLGQTFDMVIIGWTGLGSDPNDDSFWHTKYDTPDSGFNFVSYHNADIDKLLEEGVAVVGCAAADRAPFYQKIQQQIHDDVPYVFISGGVGNTGYRTEWGGLDPGTWSFYWNVHQWYLKNLSQ